MRILKFIAVMITPLAFMACSTVNKASKSKTDPVIDKIQIVESGEIDSSTDPYIVQSLKIQDSILEIEVCFGGCAEHDWKLVTSRRYKKSLPPQLDIYLIHDQHDDPCKRQDCQTLYFDISDAKYPGKTEDYTITLNLSKSNKSVNYDY